MPAFPDNPEPPESPENLENPESSHTLRPLPCLRELKLKQITSRSNGMGYEQRKTVV